jgi:hypothetical protein
MAMFTKNAIYGITKESINERYECSISDAQWELIRNTLLENEELFISVVDALDLAFDNITQ